MAVTNVFKKTLDETDFGLTSDINLTKTTWTLIAEYTVPAQQEVAVGSTEIIQGGATGRCAYMRFDHTDGGQHLDLKIRVKVVDANDQGLTINDHSAGEWSASETDRTACLLLPEDSRRAVEDSKIQIWGYATANDDDVIDVSDSDTKIRLPVTIYTIRR